jgi:hypothetical protein
METHASLVGVLDAQKAVPVPFRLTVLNHSAGFALAGCPPCFATWASSTGN